MPLTRNYDWRSELVPESNDLTYLNIPRTSLKVQDVLARSLRGAPSDVIDTSDEFDPPQSEDDWTTKPYIDDIVDADVVLHEAREKLKAPKGPSPAPSPEPQQDPPSPPGEE